MRIILIAFKNLKRKKVRTFLTVFGVSIAVAVFISLLGFDQGYQNALKNDIDKMGYQVLVTAKGCPYEAATLMLKGGGGLRYMDEKVYRKIIKDKRIDKITPQLVASVFDPDRSDGKGGFALFMGIMPSYRQLKPWVEFKSGGWFSAYNADEVIMGYEAAELEQRQVGDKIFVPGADAILTVVGIWERTGTQDDGITFLPLNTAQKIFDLPDQITGIGVKLKEIEKLAEFEDDLYDEPAIQVVSMAQVQGTIFNLISSAKTMTNSVAFIAIIIAVIGVINTILMAVFERTKEIGVMKALGASRLDIFKIIWIETVLICVLGGIFGNVFAILAGNTVEYILKQILPYAPTGNLVVITPFLWMSSFIGTIVMGLIAGVYPALRAASMHPIQAIRRGDE